MRLLHSWGNDMKSQKILLILICLFDFSQISFGQEKTQAILFDRIINLTNCCDLDARLQGFMDEVTNKNSVGYVVIHPVKGKLLPSLIFERWTMGRNFSAEKFKIVRGKEKAQLEIELWLAPKNSELPFLADEAEWNFALPGLIKPYEFYSNTNGEDAVCSSLGQKRHFAEILLANQSFRGHLVIYEKTLKKYQQTKNSLLDELVNNYNIPRSRLKTFFIKETNYDFSNIEFWLVPKKRK